MRFSLFSLFSIQVPYMHFVDFYPLDNLLMLWRMGVFIEQIYEKLMKFDANSGFDLLRFLSFVQLRTYKGNIEVKILQTLFDPLTPPSRL